MNAKSMYGELPVIGYRIEHDGPITYEKPATDEFIVVVQGDFGKMYIHSSSVDNIDDLTDVDGPYMYHYRVYQYGIVVMSSEKVKDSLGFEYPDKAWTQGRNAAITAGIDNFDIVVVVNMFTVKFI